MDAGQTGVCDFGATSSGKTAPRQSTLPTVTEQICLFPEDRGGPPDVLNGR